MLSIQVVKVPLEDNMQMALMFFLARIGGFERICIVGYSTEFVFLHIVHPGC